MRGSGVPGRGAAVKFQPVAHDPGWADRFAVEARVLEEAVRPCAMGLHHIGSTAVPGILAKPIIDILGVAPSLQDVDAATDAIVGAGYEAMGAFGIEGRRYFRKTDGAGVRTHHLHVFGEGSPHIARHLAFRDYLRAHPEIAAAYSQVKADLMRDPGLTPEGYMDGKAPFILRVERDAVAWAEEERPQGMRYR